MTIALHPRFTALAALAASTVALTATIASAAGLPAPIAFAPNVPPPITRAGTALLEVHLETKVTPITLTSGVTYEAWTFNDTVPGPMIRAREGDTLELHLLNTDINGMPHNIDLHAVTGPGGRFTATPALYWSEHVRGFMRSPHVERSLARDVYLSPLELVGREGAPGEPVWLAPGETWQAGGG